MDRPLQPGTIRQTRLRNYWKPVAAILVLVAALLWLVSWVSPSVNRSQIRTARVESGPIEASISASGMVVPEVEQVVTSSIDSRILRILRKAGDSLKANEPVVLLDTRETEQAYRKLSDQLALKRIARQQLVYTHANEKLKLTAQVEVKKLERDAAKTNWERNKNLFQDRVISRDELDKSLTAYETAEAQLKELKGTLHNLDGTTRLQDQGLNVEIRMLENERQLLEHELSRASTRSDRSGVLTWVSLSEGATVRKGDVIAKIADLSTYRIDATVSDIHAARLVVGMPVRVTLDELTMKGSISNIFPTIENGVVKLQVSLQDRSNPALRPNRRVDVHLVTGSKQEALKIRKGINAGSEGAVEIFVLRDNKAVRTRINTGLSNFEELEVTAGLQKGDEVIISDMSLYQHLKEIQVK